MRAVLRLWGRSAWLIAHLAVGLLLVLALRLDRRDRLSPEALAAWWSRHLFRIFGLQVRVIGAPAQGARLTVANHVSWLDIPLIAGTQPTRFIAKSEIRHWPIAGQFAEATGTLFIRRGRGGARPLLDRLVPHLRHTTTAVTVFPEGTTTDGRRVLPFHARLFAAAQEAGCPVQPLALRYAPTADGRQVAPFIGDDDLVRHILRLLREPSLGVELHYGAPFAVQDRDQAARQAHAVVSAALAPPAAGMPALALAA